MGNSDIKIYEFELLGQNSSITHGIFTRSGGTSIGTFDSLNIGVNSGDEKSAIVNNRKLIIQKMGMKPLVFLNQEHGKEIKVLKKDDNDLSQVFEPGKEVYTADGIVTDLKGVFLVIQVADCQAVMLYDPKKEVIANIHSGWRGSVQNIIGNCIEQMKTEFNCNPSDITACISPSLGPCCSEFVDYKDEIPKKLWCYKAKEKPYFDFWKISFDQLKSKGVKEENIENMKICTRCNMKEFYSYRGEKNTGRFACVISMN